MMSFLTIKGKPFLPIAILALTVVILFITNYAPGTYLTGWDNLHPEYGFWLNIKRSFFAVWQEYQGLGLLGGMGHAADLVHQIILWLLSFFLPISFLRYFWTLLMLLTGSIGGYYLTKHVLQTSIYRTNQDQLDAKRLTLNAFFGGIFYLLNLATVQTFYAPFEPFIAHFAFLPWLLLASLLYLKQNSTKLFAFLVVVLILATPQGYIPTLFVVLLLSLAVLTFSLLVLSRKKILLPRTVKLFLTIILVNAFWLLPFFYFTLTSANVTVDSKINQMVTETFFLQNKEFGDLSDVILLKGFWFNTVEPDREGNFDYMLKPWRDHLDNPLIQIIGYGLFAVILFGLITSIRSKNMTGIAFGSLFIFAFTMLATATPPFSWVNLLFREIPLFEQAFRFPFTKFATLAALTYAVFFAIGLEKVSLVFERKRFLLFYLLPLIFLIAFMFPAFKGHLFRNAENPASGRDEGGGSLFYEKERINVPKEYFDLFEFFGKQDPNTRIANFPQHTFWGWNFYRWGYGGSGFLWHGIKQPILDRAFDVWSHTNENYYFELSQALYGRNHLHFRDILNKYQISWLLVDNNANNPPSPQALFIPELKDLIAQSGNIEKAAAFGNIDVYKVTLRDKPRDFLFLTNKLPSMNAYTWGDKDQGYQDYGNYIAIDETESTMSGNIFYPFRALFSNKGQGDLAFTMHENAKTIELRKILPASQNSRILHIPSLLEKEPIIPVVFSIKRLYNGQSTIVVSPKTPEIYLNSNKIWGGENIERELFTIGASNTALQLNLNGIVDIPIDAHLPLAKQTIATTFLPVNQDSVITLSDKETNTTGTITIPSSFLTILPEINDKDLLLEPTNEEIMLSIHIPKIKDSYLHYETSAQEITGNPCIVFNAFKQGVVALDDASSQNQIYAKLSAKSAASCIALYTPTLQHNIGYAIFTKSENSKGRSLHFWVLNEDQKYSPIATYLPSVKGKAVSTFILAAQDSFGKSYSFHFDNISIGNEETINIFGGLSVYPIAYNYLTSLALLDNHTKGENRNQEFLETAHPNDALYEVQIRPDTSANMLVLSQSFDKAWKAYAIAKSEGQRANWIELTLPFLFGKEITDHVLVNNWENGWVLDNNEPKTMNSKLVIVYLPQYLEYLGFALLIGFSFLLISTWVRRKPA